MWASSPLECDPFPLPSYQSLLEPEHVVIDSIHYSVFFQNQIRSVRRGSKRRSCCVYSWTVACPALPPCPWPGCCRSRTGSSPAAAGRALALALGEEGVAALQKTWLVLLRAVRLEGRLVVHHLVATEGRGRMREGGGRHEETMSCWLQGK